MNNIYGKFGKYYDQIYESFYNYNQECDNLEGIFRKYCKGQPKEILDMGCGTGTHAIELSKRGYKLTGIDSSSVMIEQAVRKAHNSNADIDFQVRDMKDMDFPSKFDTAICMFGSFGYIITDIELERFLTRLKNSLRDESLFIFEFWNKECVKPGFKNWIRINIDAEKTLIRLNESVFYEKSNTLELNLDFYVFGKSTVLDSFSEVHRLRCYEIHEVKKRVSDYGFNIVALYKKDDKSQKLENDLEDAFNIIAVATKI
jgi:SAM-dependent methyltransferase